ncbi:MAG: DUF2119 domain-containing protein [Methanobrevibacter sp.]|jgi:hypothetical protein|nr:DUF2119 domain-containing protein [Methanobrevibacter sp.]
MSYFRLIEKNKGSTKLFVGGIHGKEGLTTIKFFKSLIPNDFSNGKTLIYNFDESPYISTLNKKYYNSKIGKELIAIIKKYKPDFYIELHCYNIKNYKNLVDDKRRDHQGVPPLIELNNKVLVSSVSPIIRKKYFKREDVCKIIEIPCLKDNDSLKSKEFNENLAIKTYLNFIKIIAISKNREDFEKRVIAIYPKQVDLAIKYAKEIFGKDFPPF